MSIDPAARRGTGPSADPLRVGVVGIGHWGEKHARVYRRAGAAALAGVCDLDLPRGESLAGELGVDFHPDLAPLLERVDAVSVAVPTAAHFDVARAALQAGVHVLLEKPMTASLEQADELVRLAAAGNLILQVGHLERYNPAFIFLARSVQAPRFIESHRLAQFRPLARDVSVVLDLMTHDIDLVLALVGADPVGVEAVGVPVLTDKEDITNARLTFADGCIANLTASRVSQARVRKFRLFERNRYFSADLVSGAVEVISLKTDVGKSAADEMPLDRQAHDLAPVRPLDAELEDFVANVRLGRPPRVDGVQARRALRVALEILARVGGRA